MTTPATIPAPPYNMGPKSLTVYTGGKPVTSPRFPALDAAVRDGDWQSVFNLMQPARSVAGAIAAALTGAWGDLVVAHGSIKYRGRAINNGSVQRILDLQRDGLPIESEALCLASLMRHDDARVIGALEDYVQKWNIPRTSDGRLVLAKRVRDDFMDAHTGTVDWSVGNTVRVSWSDIERDPAQTCSKGLHACPVDALHNFSGSKTIELYIWPEHIGALPNDYLSNGKIRVVEAYVSREIDPTTPRDYIASLPAGLIVDASAAKAAAKSARLPKHKKKANKAKRRATLKASGGQRKRPAKR